MEDFKRAFAGRSLNYSGLLLLVLVGTALIDYQVWDLPAQVYGLAIDLIGAAILGRGLLIAPEYMVAKATAGYGGPMPIFRANQAFNTADGIWGISLLILGIFLQGIAVVGPF